jgi:hypothetical protein
LDVLGGLRAAWGQVNRFGTSEDVLKALEFDVRLRTRTRDAALTEVQMELAPADRRTDRATSKQLSRRISIIMSGQPGFLVVRSKSISAVQDSGGTDD